MSIPADFALPGGAQGATDESRTQTEPPTVPAFMLPAHIPFHAVPLGLHLDRRYGQYNARADVVGSRHLPYSSIHANPFHASVPFCGRGRTITALHKSLGESQLIKPWRQEWGLVEATHGSGSHPCCINILNGIIQIWR